MYTHIFLLLLAALLCRCHPTPALEGPPRNYHDISRAQAADYLQQNAFETTKSKRSPQPLPEWELLTRKRYLRRDPPASTASPSAPLPTVEYEFNLFREERPTLGLNYSERRAAKGAVAATQR